MQTFFPAIHYNKILNIYFINMILLSFFSMNIIIYCFTFNILRDSFESSLRTLSFILTFQYSYILTRIKKLNIWTNVDIRVFICFEYSSNGYPGYFPAKKSDS